MTIFFFFKILLRWMRQRAFGAQARLHGTRLLFTARDVKALYGLGSVVAIALLLTLLDSNDPRWTAVFPLLFLALFCYHWPADLEINDSVLVARFWWGKRVRIAWKDVGSVAYRPADGSTFVFAVDGSEVQHSGFHSDGGRFQAEVKARAGVTQIADWDAVPSLLAAR